MTDVSRETEARLTALDQAIRKWNPAINLVSPATINDLRSRHFLDSAQLMSRLPPTAKTWLDVGTGGGFPGLVVAIHAADTQPGLKVTMVESDSRKATFLREMVRTLGLDASVLTQRIEDLPPQSADVVSARALAPLEELCKISALHMNLSGKSLYLKGRNHLSEIAAAQKTWAFDLQVFPSMTDPEAAILELTSLRKV